MSDIPWADPDGWVIVPAHIWAALTAEARQKSDCLICMWPTRAGDVCDACWAAAHRDTAKTGTHE